MMDVWGSEALEETREQEGRMWLAAVVTLSSWGLFLLGVVALIVCAKMGWL